MGTLNSALSIAVGALRTEQGALDVTTNNVANANTPGYSRQQVVFSENPPIVMASLTYGTGVSLLDPHSVRDPILEVRIQQETQQQGENDAVVGAMQQIQVMFDDTSGGDIGTQISKFFGAVSQLSTDPTNQSLRQGMLTAAGNLANAFRTTAGNLVKQRGSLDQNVQQSVQQANTLTKQIAALNAQITGLENLHENASAFIDQRTQLIDELSGLIDVAVVPTDNGVTLTTLKGTALVAGAESFVLNTQPDVSGVQHIFSQGMDITSRITSGKIAGLLQARDQKIPTLLSNLDTLAAGFANAVNTANAAGSDMNGNTGGNIFVPPPASTVGSAASMAVQMTDPRLIAASSDGSAGSNGNLAVFSAIHDQPVVAGQTASAFYAGLVFDIGNEVANGQANQEASQLMLTQLQDQRGQVSGVSLDEEAANMLLYQRAYEAAARLVSTINEMMGAAVQLGRY